MTGAFGEIRNSNFTENSAKSAAAVGLYNDANVLVISSTFLKNKAAEQGGAFVISGATTTINVSVYNAIYNEFFRHFISRIILKLSVKYRTFSNLEISLNFRSKHHSKRTLPLTEVSL